MNVVSYDPNFHDSRVVTASDLRENATEELRYPWMDERQSSQRRPSQQTVDPHRHGSNSALTSQIGLTNRARWVRFLRALRGRARLQSAPLQGVHTPSPGSQPGSSQIIP